MGRDSSCQSYIPTIHEPSPDICQQLPTEKAYLHFDNTSYYVGDTIWFKAYVTLAEQQIFSQISRPLYVELVDQTGHIADKQIIKLTQGEGNGQFVLPRSMLSGYYEIRAYTRWMLAFNEPQYFSRTFLFINWRIVISWNVVSRLTNLVRQWKTVRRKQRRS